MANNSIQKYKKEERCRVYRSVNGNPDKNIAKVIDLIGGIEKIIGSGDVVVIKPNLQWWNQGAPNLAALKTLIDLIMERPGGFHGEVVIAENCHRGSSPWKSQNSGWAHHFTLNSDIPELNNMNDLAEHLKKQYGTRFSTSHWIDVKIGNRRVYTPADGNGYVYCDGTNGTPLIQFDNGADGSNYRATIMTYPIFSSDKGTVIDFKNGIWEKGTYTGQPLRFINFAALNHHSTYCGFTSAVKNYLGINDLSGGSDPLSDGHLIGKYYNFHSFPFNKWSPGPIPGMIGAEIGTFMNSIRKADLNITSAEWIGLCSRIDTPVAHTRTIIASTDPVALDYHASKYILFPNSKLPIHNPDNKHHPAYQYLKKCAENNGGIFDEQFVKVESFDFNTKSFQKDNERVIIGEKIWGTNIKQLLKYLILRNDILRGIININ